MGIKTQQKILQNGANNVVIFNTKPQPAFNKQFDLLIENFHQNSEKGYTNYLFCDSQKQADRFHDIFDENITKIMHSHFDYDIFYTDDAEDEMEEIIEHAKNDFFKYLVLVKTKENKGVTH